MPSRGPNKGPRAVWNSASDARLVECLENHKKNGQMGSNSSWHKDVWSDAEKQLAGSEQAGGAKKSADSCHNRWTSLKKDYVQVKRLHDKSGFGWDEATQLVTASENVWDLLIQSDKPLAKWRKTAFPLYNKIHDLVVGTVATGEGVFRPGRDFTPPSSPGPDILTSSQADPFSDDQPDTSEADINGVSQSDPDVGTDVTALEATETSARPAAVAVASEAQSVSTNTRKRPADNSVTGESSSKCSRKNRTSAALNKMAVLIDNIALAVKQSSGDPSPERRKAAIKIITEDDEFDMRTRTKLFIAIRRDVAIADFVMGIEDKADRTNYLQSELSELD